MKAPLTIRANFIKDVVQHSPYNTYFIDYMTHQERAINWAEDAFNSLNDSCQSFDHFNLFDLFHSNILNLKREHTPPLQFDSSPANTLSPRSPITPPNSKDTNITGNSHQVDAPEMTEPSVQPRRKSSRRVTRNKCQAAAPENFSTVTRKNPRTTNSRKDSMYNMKYGRLTSYRAGKDEHDDRSDSMMPDISARETYLEKNRRAAQRCRVRKKVEQEELCKKAQDGASDNACLKHTVAVLQEEAFALKTELLRHANCRFEPIEEYLQKSAKQLAQAGLKERRKSTTESDTGCSMTQMFPQENDFSHFPIRGPEDTAQVTRSTSQCSHQTQQSIASFSEPSHQNDTTPTSISSAAFSPPTMKSTGNVNGSDFNLVSFKHCDGLQSSNVGSSAEGNPPDFLAPNQWATV